MTWAQQKSLTNNITKDTLKFQVISQQNFAWSSKMDLPHGSVRTPVFMPVGTKGSIKGLIVPQIEATGCRLLLGNTYHLNNYPGGQKLGRIGGLRKMMAWPYNILTDSGGFQMVSLSRLCNIDENGVKFNHPETNEEMFLRPEDSVQAQMRIGADIIMMLDHVVSSTSETSVQEEAMEWTLRWLQRNFDAHDDHQKQNLFPILQGGLDLKLRAKCIKKMVKFNANGYAIGGLSGGEKKEDFIKVVHFCCQNLPQDKPRYLMGVGYPEDLVMCVCMGVDMFDCVYPTWTAWFGTAFTKNGLIKLKQTQYEFDFNKVDPDCDCFCCQNYTRSYINSLIGQEEVAAHLLTIHNISFLYRLMSNIQEAIEQHRLKEFVNDFLNNYYRDQAVPEWILLGKKLANIE